MKKKPDIRFKGYIDDNGNFVKFENDWEQRKLSDVAGVHDGVHQTPDYQDEGIMFLSVENIATMTSEKYISEEAYERDYKVRPEKGDILMTRIGDVGTPNVVETDEKLAYYVSLALLKPKGIDSYFLNNAIQSSAFQHGLRERTLLTAIPMKINKDEIGKVDISFPTDVNEQRKIGESFKQLDNLITLHQRKCEELIRLKDVIAEAIFTKKIKLKRLDGTSYPMSVIKRMNKLEQDSIIVLNRGNIIPKSDGIYPVYSSSVKNNGLMGYANNYMFNEELITWSIDGGGDFFYRRKHKYSVTNVCGYIKILDKEYLNYLFLAEQLQYLHKSKKFDYSSKAHPSVINKMYEIDIPCLEEQLHIANILNQFNILIEQETAKIQEIKKSKKIMLEKLFC